MDMNSVVNVLESEEFQRDMAAMCAKYEAKGFREGYDKGYDDGVRDTREKFKKVSSKALRSGFSEGGEAMRELRK